MWVSSDDGLSWTPSVVGQSKDGVICGLARLGAVTIAVGATDLAPLSTDVTASNYEATSWTSLDNVTWTRGPTSVALANSTMIGITATGTGLIAVGETGSPERSANRDTSSSIAEPRAWRGNSDQQPVRPARARRRRSYYALFGDPRRARAVPCCGSPES